MTHTHAPEQGENDEIIDNMNGTQRALKRLGDICGALVGLVLTSPLFLIIYIVQRCSSRGPVFFSQERVGKGGREFHIYKFRTMVVGAEEDDRPQLAQVGDRRLTRVGKFLREHHLDELPQLWNVLRGDMSFVGYRPERQYYINQIMQVNPDYRLLYCSRPGVTSYATVHNGYTDTMEKMLRRLDMDLDYLRHRTLALDWRIILETLFNIGGGKKI